MLDGHFSEEFNYETTHPLERLNSNPISIQASSIVGPMKSIDNSGVNKKQGDKRTLFRKLRAIFSRPHLLHNHIQSGRFASLKLIKGQFFVWLLPCGVLPSWEPLSSSTSFCHKSLNKSSKLSPMENEYLSLFDVRE